MNLLKISFQFQIMLKLNKALKLQKLYIYICADDIDTDLKQHTRNKRTQPVNWYLDPITIHRTEYLPKVKFEIM